MLSGRGLCDELITRPEESYRLCCVVVCDPETSRMGAPYIYDISHLRVKCVEKIHFSLKSDKISGTLREEQYIFLIIFHSVLLIMKNISAKFSVKTKHIFYVQYLIF